MIGSTLRESATSFFNLLTESKVTLGAADAVAVDDGIQRAIELLADLRTRDGQVFLIGNGGSAAVVSHIQNDMVNKGRFRAHVLHEPSILTCMTNDYGYEVAYAEMLDRFGRRGDHLIAISSSGRSANMLAAVKTARKHEMSVSTLTGFAADNPLRNVGDINFWVASHDYGEVEVAHMFLLHYVADALVVKK